MFNPGQTKRLNHDNVYENNDNETHADVPGDGVGAGADGQRRRLGDSVLQRHGTVDLQRTDESADLPCGAGTGAFGACWTPVPRRISDFFRGLYNSSEDHSA